MKKTPWLLGITGGIAAYKTPDLVRLLKKSGKDVRVVLSHGALDFVTPLSLQAVSQNPVYSTLREADADAAMGHIALARWAKGILIAPLSANRLAALAQGMADDLLTTLCLASQAKLYVAPAMNQVMWHHPAVQQNIQLLQSRGATVLGPDWGEQACGDVGWGRMCAIESIVEQLPMETVGVDLRGLHFVITAGPTREAIDPVRFLSNRSSGKMGFALAQVAAAWGATVTLISGPVTLDTPPGVRRIDVISAQEMCNAVMAALPADIFIGAAAVADFRPETYALHKIKKTAQGERVLCLVKNPDIISEVAKSNGRPFCVGFAAETEYAVHYAREKLRAKGLDMIALNEVNRDDIGFDVADNALTVLSNTQTIAIEKASKVAVARELLTIMYGQYYAKNKAKNSRCTDRA